MIEKMETPKKHELFGVDISAVDYASALEWVIKAAKKGVSACVDHMPVHGLMTASIEDEFNNHIKRFDIVAPDGQPVRWALNHFHDTNLEDRVYGPHFTLLLCQAAQKEGIPVYFYGGAPETLEALLSKIKDRFPNLKIAGSHSPPFRKLTSKEDQDDVERINKSGAKIVFVGLGCPKQEIFASKHKGIINAVMICVGAAFDFHAGTLSQAPDWMQKRGLEWLFRLLKEPRRLAGRYIVTNGLFLIKFGIKKLY